ncbi:MAG TPA: hypothetical protein VGR26_05305 [Acidimicrobiales bacterium]|nr:hypothetical protein [Acidimicrobiales bacterium]
MEAESGREADAADGRLEVAAVEVASQWCALGRREDEAVGRRVRGKLLGQLFHQKGWRRDGPVGAGLGGAKGDVAVDLRQRLDDAHRARIEVEPVPVRPATSPQRRPVYAAVKTSVW